MNDAKKLTELMVFDLYAVLSKYIGSGCRVSRFIVLDDIDFILCRMALNKSTSIVDAAELLMMKPAFFRTRLKKLGLWDCRLSELGNTYANKSPMPTITLAMAKG